MNREVPSKIKIKDFMTRHYKKQLNLVKGRNPLVSGHVRVKKNYIS